MKIEIVNNKLFLRDFFTTIGSFIAGSYITPSHLIYIAPAFIFLSLFTIKISSK